MSVGATAPRLRADVATARSRANLLADALDEHIRTERLTPGASVGTLEDLRKQTGFARPTVSEAVRLLRDRGVLEIRPGRGGGLFVAQPGPFVRLRHTLLSVADSPIATADSIELRDHLEVLVDVGAARCRSRDDVADLRGCLVQMGDAKDWDAFMHANWALHERIAAICPNAMARAVYTATLGHISASSARYAENPLSADAYRAERYEVHVALVDAIVSQDEEQVRSAVARHNTSMTISLVPDWAAAKEQLR